jgi:hypothetical protein
VSLAIVTMQSKHILFIATTNLATNPRLFKEACLALDNDFSITIIQFYLGNCSDEKSDELCINLRKRNIREKVNVYFLNASRKFIFRRFYFSFLEKLCRLLKSVFKNNLLIAAFAHSKRTAQIVESFKIQSEN